MGAKEDFLSSLQLETSESIRGDLLEAKNPVSLYKKAVEVLGKMERNFDNALGNNAYDYFDGNVETDLDKTEFEKNAQKLSTKANELYEQMSIGSALYVLAQSKLGISSVEQEELDSLVKQLLETQKKAEQQVENDLEDDDRLNNPENTKITTNPEELEFATNIGTFRFSEIHDYNPETTPNKIQVPPLTQQFLESQYGDRRNIEATNISKLSSWVSQFCEQNPQLLAELEIDDIQNLSPKQAILLTSKIVQERLIYSDLQIAVTEGKQSFINFITRGYLDSIEFKLDESTLSKLPIIQQNEIRANPEAAYQKYTVGIDNAPIDQLLERDQQGICRNYAQVVKAIFEVFKNLQDPKNTQLTNTYCKQFGANDKNYNIENAAEREIVNNHRWNTFYTVLPNGELEEVVMDVTHTDDEGKESYSENRMLFDLIYLVDEGKMTKEQQIAQLEYYAQYTNKNNSIEYKAICEYLGDYYLEQGNKELGIKWYMKNPSMKSLQKVQSTQNLSDQEVRIITGNIISDPRNINNPQYFSFFAEYFYQKDDYKKSIEHGLKGMKQNFNFDTLIILIASCIKNNSEEWKDNHYSVDTFLENPDWFDFTDYPEELKLIAMKYGNKDK